MFADNEQTALFPCPSPPDAAVAINDRCVIRTRDGHRVVVVSGVVLAQYAVGDRMAEAHAMVSLIEQGWADQNDVARAFGCCRRGANPNLSAFLGDRCILTGMDTNICDELFPNLGDPEGTRIINARCLLRTQDGHRVVV